MMALQSYFHKHHAAVAVDVPRQDCNCYFDGEQEHMEIQGIRDRETCRDRHLVVASR